MTQHELLSLSLNCSPETPFFNGCVVFFELDFGLDQVHQSYPDGLRLKLSLLGLP